MKKLTLINESQHKEKQVETGYSFLTLFLNFLVPLYRKDLPGLLMILAYDLVAYVFWRDLGQVLPAALGFLILPMVYNKLYLSSLEEKGYRVSVSSDSHDDMINFAA